LVFDEPVEELRQELAPKKDSVLDQGPADEERKNSEEEKESINEDPPVKFKPTFDLPEVSVRLHHLAFYLNGLTKATKKKAQDADLKGSSSPPE
jgi:hypothetical protein